MSTLPAKGTAEQPPDQTPLSIPSFAQVPAWVAGHPDVLTNPTSLAVYVQILLLGRYQTHVTTTDWRELTERTGWSKSTIMRAMKVLRGVGAVVKTDAGIHLPMDDPAGVKYDTGTVSDPPEVVSDMTPTPLSTENSLRVVEDESPTPHQESMNVEPDHVSELCEYLVERIARHHETEPLKVTDRWRTDMRLLLERGPTELKVSKAVPPDVVRRGIDYTFDRLADCNGSGFCWANQIRSPGKLRSKWQKLIEAKKAQERHAKPKITHLGPVAS